MIIDLWMAKNRIFSMPYTKQKILLRPQSNQNITFRMAEEIQNDLPYFFVFCCFSSSAKPLAIGWTVVSWHDESCCCCLLLLNIPHLLVSVTLQLLENSLFRTWGKKTTATTKHHYQLATVDRPCSELLHHSEGYMSTSAAINCCSLYSSGWWGAHRAVEQIQNCRSGVTGVVCWLLHP